MLASPDLLKLLRIIINEDGEELTFTYLIHLKHSIAESLVLTEQDLFYEQNIYSSEEDF